MITLVYLARLRETLGIPSEKIDLPGNVGRWKALGTGVKATIVNGVPIVLDGRLTDAMPGHVVAPGAALATA